MREGGEGGREGGREGREGGRERGREGVISQLAKFCTVQLFMYYM